MSLSSLGSTDTGLFYWYGGLFDWYSGLFYWYGGLYDKGIGAYTAGPEQKGLVLVKSDLVIHNGIFV